MVYIDTMQAKYGRLLLSHMIADTPAELLAMAQRVGLNVKHLQKGGTYQEHFDICQAKKALAITAGAQLVSKKELVSICLARK